MVLGLLLLFTASIVLYFLFNTGQVTREKTKLVNTADAVAYSAGLLHARALNFDAYTNRALLANEVAMAQLVGLASWTRYLKILGTNAAMQNPSVSELWMFPTFIPSYTLAGSLGPSSADYALKAEEQAFKASDEMARLLQKAQTVLHKTLPAARLGLMNEVAAANYRDEGSVKVDPLALADGWSDYGGAAFARRYSGDDRKRFADLTKAIVAKDGFNPRRSWFLLASTITCTASNGVFMDWLNRRGGTEMVSYDEWKAMDTLSWFNWRAKGKPPVCWLTERPLGYGQQAAFPKVDEDKGNPDYYDGSRFANPAASVMASMNSGEWKFSGLPSYYELSPKALGNADPRLGFTLRLTRPRNQLRTTAGAARPKSAGRLATFDNPAGDVMAAVAASEVFFRRPEPRQDGKEELASLFNPYWQVHLTMPSTSSRLAAAALQGYGE
jgi:hypothetical protein